MNDFDLENLDDLMPSLEPTPDPIWKEMARLKEAEAAAKACTLVSQIETFLRRFVHLPEADCYLLLALWVIATYLVDAFDHLGYLFVYSPEKGSGKTRLLEVLQMLTYNATEVQVAPSPAGLFRDVAGKTHFLDEVDSWQNREELRNVLNAGFKRGGVVVRQISTPSGGYRPQNYPVYAARALAGIGTNILDATTRDRTFMVKILKRTQEERRERFRRKQVAPEAVIFAKRIAEWAKSAHPAVQQQYSAAKFGYLENFGDRTIDVAEPLAAILEVATSSDAIISERQRFVNAVGLCREDEVHLTADHALLRELLRCSLAEDPLIGSASELAQRCVELPQPTNEGELVRVLQRYGFKTKSTRKDGGQARYRYTLQKAQLEDLVRRYAAVSSDVVDVVTNTEEEKGSLAHAEAPH